jgi:hypothetical protein
LFFIVLLLVPTFLINISKNENDPGDGDAASPVKLSLRLRGSDLADAGARATAQACVGYALAPEVCLF